MNQATRTAIESTTVEQVLHYGHVPGMTKWLDFIYAIGQQRLSYRVRWMTRAEERESVFEDLGEAIAAYNEIGGI